jgi:hypothetical protein
MIVVTFHYSRTSVNAHAKAPKQPPRLLDQVRAVLRRKHYALRTEKVYIGWITRFIRFHHMRHPRELGLPEVDAFLTDLAVIWWG